MATYNIFRHTTGVPTPWISRYIGVWGCCACTLLAFPALALSTLTCMRPIQSHPETFCVGVSDSGDSGRIRCSGRINNVYLFLPFSVHSLLEPTGFHISRPFSSRQSVANSQHSHFSDFAAESLCNCHSTAAIGKTSCCLRDVRLAP